MSFSSRGTGSRSPRADYPADLVREIRALQAKLTTASSSSRSLVGGEGAISPGGSVRSSARDLAAAKASEASRSELEAELARKNLELQAVIERHSKLHVVHEHLRLAYGMKKEDREFLEQIFHDMWEAVQQFYLDGNSEANVITKEFLRDALGKRNTDIFDAKQYMLHMLRDEYCRLVLAPIGDETPEVVFQLLSGLEQLAADLGVYDIKSLRDPEKAREYALREGLLEAASFTELLHSVIPAVAEYERQTKAALEFKPKFAEIHEYSESVLEILRKMHAASYVKDMDKDPSRADVNARNVAAQQRQLWQCISEQDPLISACVKAGVTIPNSELIRDQFIKNPEACLKFASELFEFNAKFKELNDGAEPSVAQMAEYALYKAYEAMLSDPSVTFNQQRFSVLKDVAVAAGVLPEVIENLEKISTNKYNPFMQQIADFEVTGIISDLDAALGSHSQTQGAMLFSKKSISQQLEGQLNLYKKLLIEHMLDPSLDDENLNSKEDEILDLFRYAVQHLDANKSPAAKRFKEAHSQLRDKADEATEQRKKAVARLRGQR